MRSPPNKIGTIFFPRVGGRGGVGRGVVSSPTGFMFGWDVMGAEPLELDGHNQNKQTLD